MVDDGESLTIVTLGAEANLGGNCTLLGSVNTTLVELGAAAITPVGCGAAVTPVGGGAADGAASGVAVTGCAACCAIAPTVASGGGVIVGGLYGVCCGKFCFCSSVILFIFSGSSSKKNILFSFSGL